MVQAKRISKVSPGQWAFGCGGPIVLAVVLYQYTYEWLAPTLPEFRVAVAIASAICFSLAASSLVSILLGYGRGERSRAGVLRRARGQDVPADGEPMLVTGRVRALTAPLVAPLSGQPCVAYSYRMYLIERRPGRVANVGRGIPISPVCWGFASRPFALDGASRRVPVYAVPRLEVPVARREGDEAVRRAREFISRTRFERTAANRAGQLSTVFDQFSDTMTDADGEARRDWLREGEPVDPSRLTLEELVLPVDAEASVHGPWSSAKGGIVAPDALLAQTHVVAVLGKAEQQMDKLNVEASTTSYVVTAVVLVALGTGLIWAANIFPSLQ